ncbi:MAG: tRNA (cytidine(34)-2'-O)-methyltransferase [Gammaproteobacteria bacterium]
MFRLILFEPEIPPNTGNIIRLCANTGTALHLVGPLGFELDDRKLRRAGLDYREFADVSVHENLPACITALGSTRILACSTRGGTLYSDHRFESGDTLLLGPETRGLPQSVLDDVPPDQILRIPMQSDSRSLNLSNAAAVILYEALRQIEFGELR